MKKQTLTALTIAVVLTPLSVLTQKTQRQQTQRLSTETIGDRTEQTINHNAYDLPLQADAATSLPEAKQNRAPQTKLSFLYRQIVSLRKN